MSKHDGDQKGPQQHGEGQHGDKTHRAIIDELQKRGREPEEPAAPRHANEADANVFGIPHPGHHRLDENREQHDKAEEASELNKEEDSNREGRSRGG